MGDERNALLDLQNPAINFALLGGFIYMDDANTVLATNSFGFGREVSFDQPEDWDQQFNARLHRQGRFQDVKTPEFERQGAKFFCWLLPEEILYSDDYCESFQAGPNGAFVFLFDDDPGTPTPDPRNRYFHLGGGGSDVFVTLRSMNGAEDRRSCSGEIKKAEIVQCFPQKRTTGQDEPTTVETMNVNKGVDWDVSGKDIWVAKGLFATFRVALVAGNRGGDGSSGSGGGGEFGRGGLSDNGGVEEKDAAGPEALPPATPPTTQELELLDMGFPQQLVKDALEMHGFNKEAALAEILNSIPALSL